MEARTELGMNRQIFFVERGGWDHHNAVIDPQAELFVELNEAIEIFWSEVVRLGLQNNVVTVTPFKKAIKGITKINTELLKVSDIMSI